MYAWRGLKAGSTAAALAGLFGRGPVARPAPVVPASAGDKGAAHAGDSRIALPSEEAPGNAERTLAAAPGRP